MPPLDLRAKRPALALADTVYNVAYGSNLSLAKLRSRTPTGRTPITPRSCTRVVVRGYRLVFGLAAIPPVEPVMADAAPIALQEGEGEGEGEKDSAALLHGVMYELSAYDYESLCMSEHCAVHVPSYVEKVVLARPYEANRPPVPAILFVHARPELRVPEALGVCPSNRYLQLIVCGAREAGLDPLYIEMIERHPVARAVESKPAVLVTGLSMYCIFSFVQYRCLNRLMYAIKNIIFVALVHVYGWREMAAEKQDGLRELLWATILFAAHLPFAIVGFIFKVSSQAKARVTFHE